MPPFPELRDIAPPVEPPDPTQAIVWSVFGAILAVGLFLSLVAWVRWLRRHPRLPDLPLGAGTAALRELGELRNLAASLDSAELAGAVTESLRHYLQRARGLLARFRTTDELLGPLKGNNGPPPLPYLRPFTAVLRHCDQMKYGGAEATRSERASLVDQAIAAVEEDQRAPAWQMPAPPPLPPPLESAAPTDVPDAILPPPPPLPEAHAIDRDWERGRLGAAALNEEEEIAAPPIGLTTARDGRAPSASVASDGQRGAMETPRPTQSAIPNPQSAIPNPQPEIPIPVLPPGPPPLPANVERADAFSLNSNCRGFPVPY